MGTKNLSEVLKNYANGFYPVVAVKNSDKLLLMDFTEKTQELSDEILNDTQKFTFYIFQKLQNAGAAYGIGGYDEHRTVYSRSRVFDGGDVAEPRRLHLGVDIWGPAGTDVYAPLNGIVHSFSFNNSFGDYGATLILQHEIEDVIFHTLYGHLTMTSIENKQEGQTIEKGEWIAAFGEPHENGNWPPHLHFQIIQKMQNKKGDYPGVCSYSERKKYLSNCPDPELILQLNHFVE